MPESELNAYVFAAHPVIVRVGGDFYARSIQRANPDGSLTFFCAIDEGLVLTAAGRLDTLGVVEQMFADTEAEIGEVAAYIGFDCLHRRLDAEQRQIVRDMEDLYRRHRVVGFNTYGEQFDSMHLNQTFSGVAIGRRARDERGDELARLRAENAKLKKINAALMSRVERAMDQPNNAFGLFEVAITLDKTVRRRTAELAGGAALGRGRQRGADEGQARGGEGERVQVDLPRLRQPRSVAAAQRGAAQPVDAGGGARPTPEVRRFARQIDLALTSLEDLIRTLLDMSKLDAGAMRPDVVRRRTGERSCRRCARSSRRWPPRAG